MLTASESENHVKLAARSVSLGRPGVEDELQRARADEHAEGLRLADANTRAKRAADLVAAEEDRRAAIVRQLGDVEQVSREASAAAEKAHVEAVDRRARAGAAWLEAISRAEQVIGEMGAIGKEPPLPQILRALDRRLIDVGTSVTNGAALLELADAEIQATGRVAAMRLGEVAQHREAKIAADRAVDAARGAYDVARSTVVAHERNLESFRAVVREREATLRSIG